MTAMTLNFDLAMPLAPQHTDRISIGNIVVDTMRYRVWRAGLSIDLGTREFHLVSLLMSEPGRVFTREQILEHVWGDDAEVDGRNVDAYVKRLRRQLNATGRSDPIRTVRSVGYAFDEDYKE